MNRKNGFVILLMFIAGVVLSAETFSFSSDRLKSSISEGREKVRLTGNVVIESEKRKIEADQVDMWGENYNFFSGTGSIRVEDKERNIILQAEEFFFDKKADLMRLSGLVIMEDYENEMVIKCQYMENRSEEELIILQVGVRILKDDIVCRSEYAVFNRKLDLLELSGLPVVYKSEDKYQADIIEVNLETDEINLTGQVEGSLTTDSSDDNNEPQPETKEPNSKLPETGNPDPLDDQVPPPPEPKGNEDE